jgi:hypothetical protein
MIVSHYLTTRRSDRIRETQSNIAVLTQTPILSERAGDDTGRPFFIHSVPMKKEFGAAMLVSVGVIASPRAQERSCADLFPGRIWCHGWGKGQVPVAQQWGSKHLLSFSF